VNPKEGDIAICRKRGKVARSAPEGPYSTAEVRDRKVGFALAIGHSLTPLERAFYGTKEGEKRYDLGACSHTVRGRRRTAYVVRPWAQKLYSNNLSRR
jgi:hypothetical protein